MMETGIIGADPAPSPKIMLETDAVFLLGKPGEASARAMVFKRRRARHGTSPGVLEFVDEKDQFIFLSDADVGFLLRDGGLRKLETADGREVAPRRTLINLTEAELERCKRKRDYVLVVLEIEARRRRCRDAVLPAIRKKAAERGEDAPGFTTVLDWMDQWDEGSDEEGLASLARKVYRRSDVSTTPLDQAVGYGVARALSQPKRRADDANTYAINWLTELKREDLVDKLPTIRTFQRRIADYDRRLRAEGEYGPTFAGRIFEGKYETKLPDLPLEVVEVDHTPFDCLVLSDDETLVLGRPDVIAFRDRCTGSFLGLSIGFEAPSYASFLDGLRHAIYPKDMSAFPAVEHDWHAWGRFRRLCVDNALHFIGHNIHRAAAELKFQIAELPPGTPSMKGAQERLLGDLNMQAHRLPGATFSNVLERRDRAEIAMLPILTLEEIRAFLTAWICDRYHMEAHEGLGMLRTLKGVPRLRWERKIAEVSIAPLPPEEMFIELAGDVDFRAINAKGIRWDHIRYLNADVEAMRRNGHHRDGSQDGLFDGTRHQGTRYRVIRDPFDLSHIRVINPYLPGRPAMKVPAVRQDYAAGLTLHQHRVHIANANQELLRDVEKTEDELIRAKLRVVRSLDLLLDVRKVQGVQSKLARYRYKGQQKQARSVITRSEVDPAKSAGSLLSSAKEPRQPPAPAADVFATAASSHTTVAAAPKKPAKAATPATPRAASAAEPFDPEAFASDVEERWRPK